MYKTALLEFFVYASHASHLDILGLSEAKGRVNGTKVIDSVSYVYTGVKEDRTTGGVGIVVAEQWPDCIRSWKCVRCVMVRLKIEGGGITIVQVAPTDDKDNDTKEEFYAALQEVIARAQRGDMLVVMSDFNARVGNNVLKWSDAMG